MQMTFLKKDIATSPYMMTAASTVGTDISVRILTGLPCESNIPGSSNASAI